MDYYQYPKQKHNRIYKFKSSFRRYQSYKDYLRREFVNLCVYCRVPDTLTVAPHFSVDHYKPKSKFPSLECEYGNLFYCCSRCNPRKNSFWPKSAKDPNFVNPCDHVMGSNLRFDKATGKVNHKTKDGEFMIEVLDLNDLEFIAFRKKSLFVLEVLDDQIQSRKKFLTQLYEAHKNGKLSDADYQKHKLDAESKLESLLDARNMQTGKITHAPLSHRRKQFLA